MHYHYCIIGGGIAGVTAAETIRERDREGTIAIVSDETVPLYSRVLLPAYVKGDVERTRLNLRAIADFEKKEIFLFFGRKATRVLPDEQSVLLDDNTRLSFDKLLIASGGTPRQWPVEGGNKKGIFRLHTIDDAEVLKRALPDVNRAVVVGDKFIALEFLEIFHKADVPTTLICKHKNMFGNLLDSAGVRILHDHLQSRNITLAFEDEIAEIEGKERAERVITKNGMSLPADAVGVGIGLERNFDFLDGSGITTGKAGVVANSFLETNISGIYAAGDIAEYEDAILGSRHISGNWTGAFLQGKVAGANMSLKTGEEKQEFRFVPFYSMMSFGMNITLLGTSAPDYAESVSRGDPFERRYERFFLKDNRLAGAVLLNSAHDKPILAQLLEKRILLESAKERMAQTDFDLSTLLK
ncbi:FAD-dependent oxidoreductase [Patescibacteria group bacterium]|nr:FAD-dependent oxidoreductase [Patescibacteria group bacterium]